VKQTERVNGRRVALGTVASLACYLAFLAVSALLIQRGRVGEEHAAVCVAVCAALASFVGAKLAAWGSQRPLPGAAVCVGAAFAAVALLGFLFNNTLDWRRMLCVAAAMAAGGVCALLRGGKRTKKRARRPRR